MSEKDASSVEWTTLKNLPKFIIQLVSKVDPKYSALDEDIFEGIADVIVPGGAGVNIPAKTYLQGLPWSLGSSFGVYLGSQSHPPCHGGVYWLIAQQTYKVAKDKVSRVPGKMTF